MFTNCITITCYLKLLNKIKNSYRGFAIRTIKFSTSMFLWLLYI